jgi:hypothetical protein
VSGKRRALRDARIAFGGEADVRRHPLAYRPDPLPVLRAAG